MVILADVTKKCFDTFQAANGKELEGKPAESKGKIPLKRSKGSLGSLNMITGKGCETGKASGASDNGGGFSQR